MRPFAFLLAVFCPLVLLAELPPSAYEQMQAKAPEYLEIEILRVEIEPASTPNEQKVHLMALINKVTRSASERRPGDVINILYTITQRPKGWSGPGEIPVLSEKEASVAYLEKAPGTDAYKPVAGTMSFRNF